MGTAQMFPIAGGAGTACFPSMDDETALVYINERLIERLKTCVRGELSSLRVVADPSVPHGKRFVDDSHMNPHFQDSYVRYNPRTNSAELDFDSTRTVHIAGHAK